jgi:hypothetical protein
VDNFNLQDFAILDFSFTNFVTTKLIKVLYAISLIFIVLGFFVSLLVGIWTMFDSSFGSGAVILCMSPFVLVIYVLMARVWSEFIIVIFRIAENMAELVEQGREKEE